MKKNVMINIIFCLFLLKICGCNSYSEKHYMIKIKNNASINICYYFYLVWEPSNGGVVYPDTLISFDKMELVNIKSGKEFNTSRPISPITEWIATLPQDTLSIFFFSKDTVDKYDWSEIQSGYKILQRYDLSIEDFDKLSDAKSGVPIITYPPTKEMKDMKMWPPYGNK